MRKIVVDASVAAAWLIPELHGEDALTLRREPNVLIAPELMLVEFANVLWKKVERAEFEHSLVESAWADVRRFQIRWHPDTDLLPDALKLGMRHHHPIYDCLYLALCQREQAVLATQDRRMASLAGRLMPPVPIWQPRST